MTTTRNSKNNPAGSETWSMLAKKLSAPGGISLDQALETACLNVGKLRQEYVECIPKEIDRLNQILRSGDQERVTPDQLKSLLECAGLILTLTGTFQCTLLDSVVRKFCDLCGAMLDRSLQDPAPLMVHIQAMSILFSATINGINQDGARQILKELEKIQTHFNVQPGGGRSAARDEAVPDAAIS